MRGCIHNMLVFVGVKGILTSRHATSARQHCADRVGGRLHEAPKPREADHQIANTRPSINCPSPVFPVMLESLDVRGVIMSEPRERAGIELRPCVACGREVSTSAPTCPHCGQPWPAFRAACPICYSENTLIVGPQGFSPTKAAAGGAIFGVLGLLAGQARAKDIKLKCQSCGHLWAQSVEQMVAGMGAGQRLRCRVIEIKSYGAFVSLPSGGTGLIHISKLSPEYVKNVDDVVSVGDEVEVEVTRLDRHGRPQLRLVSKE